MTPREVLLLRIGDNDSGATTVGGYLQALLVRLWDQVDRFDGKRPFGNSGWEHDLYRPLIAAGAATGKIDTDGYVVDKGNADQVVHEAIDALFPEQWSTEVADRIAAAALHDAADRFVAKYSTENAQ